MDEERVLVINWKDMYEPTKVYTLLQNLKHITINNVNIDNTNHNSIIVGSNYDYIVYNRQHQHSYLKEFELLPDNEVKIQCFLNGIITIKYNILYKRVSDLEDFPEINNFISKYCSYISDWLMDNNLERDNIKIVFETEIQDYFELGVITDIINHIEDIKSLFNNSKRKNELSILILAAIIKTFYNSDHTKSFMIPKRTRLLRSIKNNIDDLINVIKNPESILKTNNFIRQTEFNTSNFLMDEIQGFGTKPKKIRFMKNIILSTSVFKLYEENPDLKFLYYASTR